MAEERRALSMMPPDVPADTDYNAIFSAVMATARGRWFLAEFTKRNRNTDTTQVLAAIERIEGAVGDGRAREANQEVRIELLEMARAIAQTRAEVAESSTPAQPAPPFTAADANIAGSAARLRDIARTMRSCGIEPQASHQIEQIAETILSASALRDPGDHRAGRLAEVLQYLEHRIDRMLDGHQVASPADVDREPARAEQPPSDADAAPVQPTEAAPALDSANGTNQTPPQTAVLATLLGAMTGAEHTAGGNPVTMQVDEDLRALTELPAPETESADQSAAAVPPPPSRPIPSMWEHRDGAATPATESIDPLASLAAMTDEERIALFT